jgi:hypothetical protein
MTIFSEETLKQELMNDALAVRIPEGQAEELASLATAEVKKWLEGRGKVTRGDIQRVIYQTLMRHNENLAFAYAIEGRVI